MTRPLILDTFACEGIGARGYIAAGFDVVGVDIGRTTKKGNRTAGPLRHYPGPYVVGDALDVLARLVQLGSVTATDGRRYRLTDFAAIHASPPCQAYSITKHSHGKQHPELVEPTRDLLRLTGLPYVIENVEGAPLIDPVRLCGAAFECTAVDDDGEHLVLKRHRLFESNVDLRMLDACACAARASEGYRIAGAYGGGSRDKDYARNVRKGGYTPSKRVQAELIGVPEHAHTLHGLAQCIPPIYTQAVGVLLQRAIRRNAA